MRRARPSTGRWRRCGNTGRSMLHMSRGRREFPAARLVFFRELCYAGTTEQKRSPAQTPEPAANRGRSRRLTRIRFAPPKRRSGISAHLRCAGGYRRAVRHTAGFVPNREGRGGHGNRLSRGPLPGPGPGASLRTLYAVSNRIPAHYHRAEVPKRDGGVRVLRVPDPVLKDIQRRIARVLLSGMPVSPHATAYRYGAGVVENARRHVGRPELLKLDILHFFDSIRYIQVKEAAFPAEIYAEPLRTLLSMLCYDRDVLPQGAPTSPWIANLVLRPFDEKLGAWCRARGVVYTRYCDDLAFSGTALDGVEERAEEGLRALGSGSTGPSGRCAGRPAEAGHRPGGQRTGGRPRLLPPQTAAGAVLLPQTGCRGAPEGCRPGGGAGAVPASLAGAGGLLAPGPAGQPGGGGVPPLAAGRDAGMGVKRGGHMGNGVLLTAAM